MTQLYCSSSRSPKDDEGTPIEKRRSGRNTNKRKKYVDEVDLNLSDEENLLSSLPPDFAAEIKAGSGMPNTRGTQPPSGSASVPAPSSIANDDSNLNGDSMDVTQNSEMNADDTQSAIDLLHSGPNYAYIVSRIYMFSYCTLGNIYK